MFRNFDKQVNVALLLSLTEFEIFPLTYIYSHNSDLALAGVSTMTSFPVPVLQLLVSDIRGGL